MQVRNYSERSIQYPTILENAITEKEINLPDDVKALHSINQICMPKTGWFFAEKSHAGPDRVIEYLGRYTNRVALYQ